MRKKVASVLLTVCLLATLSPHVSAKEPTFSDTSGHWAETQIEAWANRGIIQGSDGAFRPNAYITRGAVAAIIDRILKYPTADANTFLDLPDNSYFTESVLKLSHAGVMLGYTDRTARPNASVTRQEVVVLLARAFHVEESPDTVLTYADKADISPFAVNAVKDF